MINNTNFSDWMLNLSCITTEKYEQENKPFVAETGHKWGYKQQTKAKEDYKKVKSLRFQENK